MAEMSKTLHGIDEKIDTLMRRLQTEMTRVDFDDLSIIATPGRLYDNVMFARRHSNQEQVCLCFVCDDDAYMCRLH
jgi:hypothetical protein